MTIVYVYRIQSDLRLVIADIKLTAELSYLLQFYHTDYATYI